MHAKHHPHVVFVRTALETMLCELMYFSESNSVEQSSHKTYRPRPYDRTDFHIF